MTHCQRLKLTALEMPQQRVRTCRVPLKTRGVATQNCSSRCQLTEVMHQLVKLTFKPDSLPVAFGVGDPELFELVSNTRGKATLAGNQRLSTFESARISGSNTWVVIEVLAGFGSTPRSGDPELLGEDGRC